MDQQYQQIQQYIQDQLAQGADLAVVQQQLLQVGWDQDLVQKVLSDMQAAAQQAPSSQPQPQPQTAQPADVPQSSNQFSTGKFPIKLIAIISGILAAVVGLAILLLVVFSGSETPEQVFRKFISTNTATTTLSQTYNINPNSEDSGTFTITASSDFSDPTQPKSEGSILLDVKSDNVDVRIPVDFRVLTEDVYIYYNPLTVDYKDDAFKAQVEAFGGYEQLLALPALEQWISISQAGEQTDPLQIYTVATGVNTVLGEMPIGNFGEASSIITENIINSYTVDYEAVMIETIGSIEAMKLQVETNEESIRAVNLAVAEVLNLSDKQRGYITESNSENLVTSFTVWVDPETYRPIRVSADGVEIEYSNFGSQLDITQP